MRQTKIQLIFMILGILFLGSSARPAKASDITNENVLRLINDMRETNGLPDLELNEQLDRAAKLKAQDMLEKKYFAHTAPDGSTPWHWFYLANYDYSYAGENLAIDFDSAEAQNLAWMRSATHRKNILNDKYTQTGIAVATGKIGDHISTITVEVFAAPKGVLGGDAGSSPVVSDKAIDWESARGGIVLASRRIGQALDGNSEVFQRWNATLSRNSNQMAGWLWTLMLLVASFLLIFNPAIFVEKSYEKIYQIIHNHRFHRLRIYRLCLEKYEKWLFRLKSALLSKRKMEFIRSVRLRV